MTKQAIRLCIFFDIFLIIQLKNAFSTIMVVTKIRGGQNGTEIKSN